MSAVRVRYAPPSKKPLLPTKAKGGFFVYLPDGLWYNNPISENQQEEHLMILLVIDMQKALVDEDLYGIGFQKSN